MKRFLSFVHKEILHIIRDPRTLVIAILIPVVQLILFGFALSTEVNEVRVAAVVPVLHGAANDRLHQIENLSNFTLVGIVDEPEADACLKRGEVDAVIFFADDYDVSGRIGVAIDGSNTISAQAIAGYIAQVFSDDKVSVLSPGVTMLYNPQLLSSYNFVPGIMGFILILICAMLTSVSIVREKETGTMELLLVSPIRPIQIVIAKMVPYFLLGCIDLLAVLLLAKYLLAIPLAGSMTALFLTSFLYIIAALALGLLVSTIAQTQLVALLISGMVFIIPVIMLSGMIFPIENMPKPLQIISCIVPARWYISAMRKVMIEGLDFQYILTETIVLLGMTIFLIVVSVKRFKNKLQ